MGRPLFNILSAASLTLCVAIAILWATTAHNDFEDIQEFSSVSHYGHGRWAVSYGFLVSHGGHLGVFQGSCLTNAGYDSNAENARADLSEILGLKAVATVKDKIYDGHSVTDRLGFIGSLGTFKSECGTLSYGYLTVPHWSIVAALSVLPVFWIARKTR